MTTTNNSNTARTWQQNQIYIAGELVTIGSVTYRANWWTQGNDPTQNNGALGTGEPWTIVSSGSTSSSSGSSTQIGPIPVPNAPTQLAVTSTTANSATLTWSAASVAGGGTVTGYAIFENGVEVGTVSGTSTSYTATNLTAATAYAFTVEAIDSSGASAPTAAVTGTTAAGAAPAAPTALTSSSVTSNSVVLSWTPPSAPAGTAVTGYTILYNGVAIGTTTTTSFTLNGLAAATSYKLSVEASDPFGSSVPSTALTVTTPAASSPPPDYSKVPAWSATTVYTAGMTVTENGIVYSAGWWTEGNDPSSSSGVGQPWTVIGKVNNTPTAPNAPTGVSATVLSSTSVSLLWNPATVNGSGAVSGYAIFENGKQIAVTSNTYYNVNNLTASTGYNFSVEAIDVTGYSPASTAVSATTPAAGTVIPRSAVFAPYYDMTLYGNDNLLAVSQASGIKTFTLAFIQSSGTNTIGWAGTGTLQGATTPDGSSTTMLSQIQALQAAGGDVIISFGGENGIDPASAAGATMASLQAEYQSVIDMYGVNKIDFDIEGGPVTDQASINLRNQALVGLEKANPNLQVSFTLPVLPTGLDANGLNVVKSAQAAGVKLSVVNIMTMDYGGYFDTGASMGTMAIEAIQATEAQLASIGMNAKIGVTPLIGINDDSAEVFTLADAQQLADYVATDPNVARVAMWSVARDNGSSTTYGSATSSGVAESNYQFSSIFEETTASVATAPIAIPVPTTPTQLAATTTTSSSTALIWAAATVPGGGTVTGYEVFENGTQLATVTSTSYTATGLSASTAYKFTVAAVDSTGASAPTAALTVTTPAGVVPAAPTNLTASSLTNSSVALAWTAPATPAGATLSSYTILENGVAVGTTTNRSYTVTGLSASTKYSLAVEASDQYGLSAASTALAITTPSAVLPPPTPTNLTDASLTSSSVVLSWKAPTVPAGTTLTGYVVYENGTQVATVTGTSYTATGLNASTAYKFTVAAIDSAGSSAQTAPLAVSTPAGVIPSAPTGLTDTSLTSTSLVLAWTAPSTPAGATLSNYTILNNGVAIGTTTNTSFTVTGLTASTSYNLAVEASDQYGVSKPSTALAVTTPAGSTTPPGNVPAWSATAIYTAGMTASESGIVYTANWWTQGNDPISNSGAKGTGEPWTATGKVNTTPTAPDAPTGLTAAAASSTDIDLYWNPATVSGSGTVSNYAVFENGTQIATTTNTFYDAGSLTASTAYKFSVEAIDATGASPQSAAVSATTLAPGAVASTTTYAPYIDMTLTGNPSLAAISQASGIKTFTLAFIQSSGSNTIGWGGAGNVTSDTTILSQVQALRSAGGNVIISFGGAAGTDPATVPGTTVAGLQSEYQSVIDHYGVNSLDFDIEGGAEGNQASLTLRDQALVGLEKANPGLQISYTLPVLPTGLDSNGLNIIQTAVKDGVHIDVINIMAMDYGSSNDNGGAMGTDAIDAIQATEKQLASAGLSSKVGIAVMLGVNDTSSEVFTLADAQQLANYVATDPKVGRVSEWSVSRDNGSTAGQTYASATGSGLTQTPYQFASILEHA